jgi:hypothetical protein
MRALPTASLPHSHPHKRASHRRCANPFSLWTFRQRLATSSAANQTLPANQATNERPAQRQPPAWNRYKAGGMQSEK